MRKFAKESIEISFTSLLLVSMLSDVTERFEPKEFNLGNNPLFFYVYMF
jgi:hypothetical protein